MERLDLSHNNLSGSIAIQFGELTDLSYLFFSSNAFTGVIPVELFDCTSLVVLDLSANSLIGSIPAQISRLSNLLVLNLSQNGLWGELPLQMSQMQRLSVLDLSRNSLNSTLPNFERLRQLQTLRLSDNKFSGPLPTALNPGLTELDMGRNLFEGQIPPQLGNLSSLQFLDLSSNKLTGHQIQNLTVLSALRHLSLAQNGFTSGSFPSVDGLWQLELLNLSWNHLVGHIPETIGNMSNLTTLQLSNNNLNGSIPLSIANLHHITYLDLHNNHLSGNVSLLAGLTLLTYVNLSNNNWSSCIPSSLLNQFGSEAFEGGTPCEPLAANISSSSKRSSRDVRVRLALILGIVLGCALAFCFILSAAILYRKRKPYGVSQKVFYRDKRFPYKEEKFTSGPFSFETDSGTWVANVRDPSSVPVVIFEKPLLNLTFADLLQATSNFSKESQLTEGGFGPVYEAVLPGGLHVAIKALTEGRILTDSEAAAEFGKLASIRHPNLVPLLGYCLVGDERLVLYKYMENGGLHRWLYDLPIESEVAFRSRDISKQHDEEISTSVLVEAMNWSKRHKVALGTARALAFLHHGYSVQLVHRDVKSSNVMLDAEFEPHLANTGLAGLLAANDFAFFAGGTPGYVPPEYGQLSGNVTIQGDVYSFGVILLELLTGKSPVGDFYQEGYMGNLVGWVKLLVKQKQLHMAMDHRLMIVNSGEIKGMLEALRIGYLCTQELPTKRPTMQQVVGLLKDIEPNVDLM